MSTEGVKAVLGEILASFNALFGDTSWRDEKRIRRRVTEEVPARVAENPDYKIAVANNDQVNAKVTTVEVLAKVDRFGSLR